MRQTLALSRLYLLGHLRRQIHIATVLLGGVMLMLPSYVDAFSLGLHSFERVAKEFGLSAIGFFGVAMAILIGSTTIAKDLETRAIYPILARPLQRGGYLLAHFVAMAVLLTASVLFLGLCFAGALMVKSGQRDMVVMVAVYASLLQALIVGTVCLVSSVRASPPLAGTIGAAVFLIGNLSGAFIRFFLVEDRGSMVSASLARGLKAVLPDLTLFNLKDMAVHSLTLPPGYLPAITYNAAIWVVLLLLLGRLVFQRVDL